MTQETDEINNEYDDLTCPITLEVFRDPVIAEDGHVYEREAITKWILEHGTSPFTRQQLDINNLQSDDHLRRLAARRRNSNVSYNAQNNMVTLPPLRRVPRNNILVPQQRLVQVRTNYPKKKFYIILACFTVVSLLIGMSITLGIVLGTQSSNSYSNSTGSQITSNYSGALTYNSSFTQQWWSLLRYYYQAIEVVVSINGFYEFRSISRIDMCGSLYSPYFVPINPSINRLIYDDDSGGSSQFYFRISLRPDNYTLIATTNSAYVTGSFSIVVSGPANVILR